MSLDIKPINATNYHQSTNEVKMNFLMNLHFLLALTSFLAFASSASPKVKHITVNGHKWLATFSIKPSKPADHGQGFCGSGQEVTLKLQSVASKKIVFTKLIESCLESIELENGNLGEESTQSLSDVVNLDKNPIEIKWLNFKGKTGVRGKIDLTSGVPSYSELP